MAGVTPVYVVNMPGAGLPGVGGRGSTGGAARTAGRVAGRARSLAVLAGGLPLSAWGTMGLSGLATAGAGVTAALGGGYAVGSGINWAAERMARGTRMEGWGTENIGGAINKVLAFFGNEESRRAVAINEAAKAEAARAELHVTVEDSRVRVTRLTAAGMDVDVDDGLSMAGR